MNKKAGQILSTLQVAWKRVCANKDAAGVDSETINEIKESGVEKFLKELQNELWEEKYCPNSITRVYIKKVNASKRPLFWRRRKQLKRINGCRKWKNAYYYENGLLYISELLRRKTNAAI